jgi:hypothetical protein
LELRDQFPTREGRRYSLFAALRDGTGEAKIDLRPGSDFLRDLNARPWPELIPIQSIAGLLLTSSPEVAEGIEAASAETGSGELQQRLSDWWSSLGANLGDGVVPLDSTRIPGGAPPLVLEAAHRGLLARLLPGDPEPPAIAPILETLRAWDARTQSR